MLNLRSRTLRALGTLLALVSLLGACSGDPTDKAAGDAAIPAGVDPRMVERRSDGLLVPSADSLRKTPGYVVDSVFSAEENLRRFRLTVSGTPPDRLTGGEPTTDALLRRYWALLAIGDTLKLSPVIVSRAEYAYLYAPVSPEFASGLPPHVGWEIILSQSGRGLTRALAAAQRAPAPILATLCSDTARVVGSGRLYGPCGVVVQRPASVDTAWIAKSLFARDGRHKLLITDVFLEKSLFPTAQASSTGPS
jgi:hypothetical protein